MKKWLFFVEVIEELKIGPAYDGFLFLAESARNPPALPSHRHRELEFNLVAHGEVTYVVFGKRYTFRHRDLLWFFPTQEHRLVDRTPDAQYYVAVFKPDLVAGAARSRPYRGLRRGPGHDAVLRTGLDPETFDLMKKTMDCLLVGGLDPDVLNREAGFGHGSDFVFRHSDPAALNAGLLHLLLLGWRCRAVGSAGERPVSLHPAVAKALAALAEDPGEENLARLASRCGASPAYLSRTFSAQIGVPMQQYRNSLRISRFWDLWNRPAKPSLTEAALDAGFGSYAQFFKIFSRAYGAGPRKCLAAQIAPPPRHSQKPAKAPKAAGA